MPKERMTALALAAACLMYAGAASANIWTTPDGATVNGLPVAASADVFREPRTILAFGDFCLG